MKTMHLLFFIFFILSCQKNSDRMIDSSYNPDYSPARFPKSTEVTNSYFGLEPGKTYVYEGVTADGKELDEVKRLTNTKKVAGIDCIIVEDKAYVNGKLVEYTHDWFAQDKEGNVWYFGEQVDNYDSNGKLVDHGGSWEANIDGAKAGLIMPAKPNAGMKYRQEYYFNEAEDEAEILSNTETVTIPKFATFTNCLKIKEFTALEPKALEHKYFAEKIGLIKIINVTDNEEALLTAIK